MKKIHILIALALLIFPVAVIQAQTPVDDRAERVRLSKDLHDIRQIRDRINSIILEAAETIPPEDREDFQKYVQLKIDYDALEAKSITYAAEVYTASELRAMVAYFGSADGKSAEAKGTQFGDRISKAIVAEIDAAIMAAKYDGVPAEHLPKIDRK